jgi:hypothetical protein
MTCTTYCVKIEEVFDAMMHLSSEVLPENQQAIWDYIHIVWQMVTVFAQSIRREEGLEELRSKFEPYVTAEEARIRQKLEGVNYIIDGSDTFNQVIVGDGRIETVIDTVFDDFSPMILTFARVQTLFPTFYLVLKRDLEKINLGRKHVLSGRELAESAHVTISSIATTALDRIEDLKSVYRSRVSLPRG